MPAIEVHTDTFTLEQKSLTGKVSAKGFQDVALLTGNMRARGGHNVYLDEKTIETGMAALMGRSVPSYLTHDGATSADGRVADRLGKEIGVASGAYRDGNILRARQLNFLDSFAKHNEPTRDGLVELAEKHPDQLGVSLVLTAETRWVLDDGTEVDGEWPKPANAIRDIPSLRILSVKSADLVQRPAANVALFSEESVDAAPSGMATTTTSKNSQTITLSVDQLSAKVEELTVSLAAKDTEKATALAAKDAEILALAEKLASAEKTGAAKDAAIKQSDERITALSAERDEALKFDIRKTGVRHDDGPEANAGDVSAMPLTFASDAEKWEHYAKLSASDPEAAKLFHEKNLKGNWRL